VSRRQGLFEGGAATLALRLFLISLAILFAASLVGYALTRVRLAPDAAVPVPALLWAGTLALLGAGLLLEGAWRQLRRGQVIAARGLLRWAGGSALLFFCLQTPALWQVYAGHRAATVAGNPLLGFVFFLILLHALHVAGGLAALGRLLRRSGRRPLIPDQDGPALRLLSRYWHFLDAVWLVMFGAFLLG
jgi:cytochrome c oxidase subunit III